MEEEEKDGEWEARKGVSPTEWIMEVEEKKEREREVAGQEKEEENVTRAASQATCLGTVPKEKVQHKMEAKRAKERARMIPG